MHRLGVPQAERINRTVVVADNRHVIGNRHDRLIIFLDKLFLAVFLLGHADIAAKLDFHAVFRPADFKGIAVFQPFIRLFHLIAINNFLFKNTIAIANAAAIGRVF